MRFSFLMLASFAIVCSCKQNETHEQKAITRIHKSATQDSIKVSSKADLPFIGIRSFETREGVSGTGTPARSIEIKKNGDVYFSFIQINQADKDEEISERYYAGKFQPYMKCVFKKWYNEVRYYQITKDKIYEVDSTHKRLTSDECCGSDNIDMGDKCPCEGDLYSDN